MSNLYDDPTNNNNNVNNDSSYDVGDVDDEARAYRQQQLLDDDPCEAGVKDVNFLLEILSMKAERPVLRLSQLSSSFFVLAFRQLFGEVPDGVNIAPQSVEDRINNARVVIESIESKLDMSLAHISPELVATHDQLHISKLLRVFVDIVTPSEGEMMGLAGDDTRGEDDDENDESIGGNDHHQYGDSEHQLFHNNNNQQQHSSVQGQYGGSNSKQQRPGTQHHGKAAGQHQRAAAQQGASTTQQHQQQGGATVTGPNGQQPQVMVRDWLTGLYSHGNYEKQPDSLENVAGGANNTNNEANNNSSSVNNNNNTQQQYHQQGGMNNNNNSSAQQQQQQHFEGDDHQQQQNQHQQPPLYQQQFDGTYNNNNNNNSSSQQQQQYHQDNNNNNNIQNIAPSGGADYNNHNNNNNTGLSSTLAEARRVRRVADFIERSNIPRYETQLCNRLSGGDGRYVRQFTGDGPLSTVGVASMQKQSTTNNASMARRPLPAMSNARRDAKIERLRSEKFLQDAQDRAVREVVRQASREEVRMVQELKQQLTEQRQTFMSLDKLAKEKDQRLRQIYSDNVISSIGAAKNKGMKLNLHKNAADLVRREREVVEREKTECESEIRLQFEVLRAKRESYLSHLSSWRVAVMKQQQPVATTAPTSSRQHQQQPQKMVSSSRRSSGASSSFHDPHAGIAQPVVVA